LLLHISFNARPYFKNARSARIGTVTAIDCKIVSSEKQAAIFQLRQTIAKNNHLIPARVGTPPE